MLLQDVNYLEYRRNRAETTDNNNHDDDDDDDNNSHQEDSSSMAAADLPPYLIPNSPEEPVWRQHNPNGWSIIHKNDYATEQQRTEGTTELHQLVVDMNVPQLVEFFNSKEQQQSVLHGIVNKADHFGWTPLHEAVRTLRGDIVHLLVERGNADIHAITKDGMSPLALAYYSVRTSNKHNKYNNHPQDHPVVRYLENLGAKKIWHGEEL